VGKFGKGGTAVSLLCTMIPLVTYQNKRYRETDLLWNIAAFAFAGLSSYGCYRLVRRYGWEGALRYIWEGDPLPHDVRECIDTLEKASKGLEEQETVISSLEEGLERAHLDTVDESSHAAILEAWRVNLPRTQQDIRGNLAMASAKLDTLAADIDQVENKETVRQTKKDLSRRVVDLMVRIDLLIDFFKQATNERFKI
jgi:hypothetical protein